MLNHLRHQRLDGAPDLGGWTRAGPRRSEGFGRAPAVCRTSANSEVSDPAGYSMDFHIVRLAVPAALQLALDPPRMAGCVPQASSLGWLRCQAAFAGAGVLETRSGTIGWPSAWRASEWVSNVGRAADDGIPAGGVPLTDGGL